MDRHRHRRESGRHIRDDRRALADVATWNQDDTPIELKCRLLYNAVTRARPNCVIIADGAAYKWADDRMLNLVGHPTKDLVMLQTEESWPSQASAFADERPVDKLCAAPV